MTHFHPVFHDFFSEKASDVQTFLEAKQDPQARPETPTTLVVKFRDFLKNRFFDFFSTKKKPVGFFFSITDVDTFSDASMQRN